MKKTIIALLYAGAALCANAHTIDELLREIEANNLELKAARHDVSADIADAKADNTLAGPSAEFSPFWQKDVSGLSSSELIVSQEFDFPSVYAARSKAVKAREEMLSAQFDAARRDLLLDAKLQCIELVKLQQQRRLVDGRHGRLTRVLQFIRQKDSAGASTALEVNKALMELSTVESEIAANETEQLSLIEALTALNGGFELDTDSVEYAAEQMIADFETFRAEAMASDPAIVAARNAVDAAGREVDVSRTSWLPSINVGYRCNAAPGEAQNGMVVGLSFPVWSNSHRVRAARERHEAARLRAEDTGRQLETALRQQYIEMTQLYKSMGTYDMDMMTRTLALLVKAVEAGQITVFEYFNESEAVYGKIAELIDARYRYNKVLATLTRSRL
ncbi:MAG: TolC family protein [Candidatus Amulumruptor sp.]|nr:TolC family protein [Candidatus Amulumruptor sp.]